MIKWREAYERLKGSKDFRRFFGGGDVPSMSDFRYIAFSLTALSLTPLTPSAAVGGGTPGVAVGPLQMPMPAGAVVLGITSGAYLSQQAAAAAAYAPSSNGGRRDLYALQLAYTSDENITPNGLVMAETLLGSGEDSICPGKEIVIPPSQAILVTAASLLAPGLPNLFAHITFHAMVPRAVG